MGSGDRFKVWRVPGIGLGVNVDSFPFAFTLSVHLLFWGISIGLGKAYDGR